MKREGRQHGMVRSSEIRPSSWNPRPHTTRIVNKINTPPTAGIFMKVSSKPTNHSKFTGKCRRSRCVECHTHPASKSKDKAKGTHKQKAYNLHINDRSIAWKLFDGVGSSYTGFSATAILGQLATRDDQYWDDNYDEEEDVEYDLDDVYNLSYGYSSDNLEEILPLLSGGEIEEIDHEPEEEEEEEEEEEDDDDDDDDDEDEEEEDDDDDRMSFCEVGFVFELEDEGWCVVEEM